MQINSRVVPFAYSRDRSGRRRNLAGLGDDLLPALATAAATAYGGPAAGAAVGAATGAGGPTGGSAQPAMPITVSPTLQTQISPQISPVFQQSYMPQNSAMTAGTTQNMPTTQSAPGGYPGMPGMPNADASGFPSAFTPPGYGAYSTPPSGGVFQSTGAASFMSRYGMLIAGGGVALAILYALTRKPKATNAPA